MFNDEHRAAGGGYCALDLEGDHERYCEGAVALELGRGDMLLWDSRTIHCNQGLHRTLIMTIHCNQGLHRTLIMIVLIRLISDIDGANPNPLQ